MLSNVIDLYVVCAASLYFPLLPLANEMEGVESIGRSCWVWHFVLNSVSLSLDCV